MLTLRLSTLTFLDLLIALFLTTSDQKIVVSHSWTPNNLNQTCVIAIWTGKEGAFVVMEYLCDHHWTHTLHILHATITHATKLFSELVKAKKAEFGAELPFPLRLNHNATVSSTECGSEFPTPPESTSGADSESTILDVDGQFEATHSPALLGNLFLRLV